MQKLFRDEEFWNVITHGLGIILSLIGSVYLIYIAMQHDSSMKLTAVVIFSASMILLYSASTIYHYHSFRKKIDSTALKRLDHVAIYYLIAGTYTPFTLLVLQKESGYYLLLSIWILALIGTLYKIFFLDRFKWLSLTLYLLMGWLIIVDIVSFVQLSPSLTLWLMILGGCSYTLGTVFYVNHKIPYHHTIWHGFVLLGTIFHYFSIVGLFIE